MDRSRTAGWVAEKGRRAGRLHLFRISSLKRAHLAALLIVAALPLRAGDIKINPGITQEDFGKFSRIVAQGIFASPVHPAGAQGLLRFDVGVAATLVHIDTKANYYRQSVSDDITVGGDYIGVPRLVVVKGLGGLTVAGTYAKVTDAGGSVLGGSIDLPIIRGGLLEPTVALRGSYATLRGVDELDLKVYGLEGFIGKGFSLLTVYGGYGRQRSKSVAHPSTPTTVAIDLRDNSDVSRYTVGVRFSLGLPKIVVEATQAEERAYSAKISFGL